MKNQLQYLVVLVNLFQLQKWLSWSHNQKLWIVKIQFERHWQIMDIKSLPTEAQGLWQGYSMKEESKCLPSVGLVNALTSFGEIKPPLDIFYFSLFFQILSKSLWIEKISKLHQLTQTIDPRAITKLTQRKKMINQYYRYLSLLQMLLAAWSSKHFSKKLHTVTVWKAREGSNGSIWEITTDKWWEEIAIALTPLLKNPFNEALHFESHPFELLKLSIVQ